MTKQAGFLTQKLGQITVFCNRSKGGLWYVMENGEARNLDKDGYVSFQSVENGLKGLNIYRTVRYQEDTIKMALTLEGEEGQIYKFETGVDTAFARGMLWGISHMTEEDIKGRIGLNPNPGDDLDSKNAKSLLFCNLYVNGVEMPRLPKGEDAQKMDWQAIAHKALCLANCCEYPIAEVPHSSVFWDKDTADRPVNQSPQKTQPAARTAQNARSGVTYPQQPLKTQSAPVQTQKQQVQPIAAQVPAQVPASPNLLASPEELEESYIQLMDYVTGEYAENNIDLDEGRIAKFIERNRARNFDELTLGRKHQMIASLAADLVEAVQPENENIAKLRSVTTPGAIGWEQYTVLSDLIVVGFTEINPPTKKPEPTTETLPPIKPIDPDAEIPF